MSKYHALFVYLNKQTDNRIKLTYEQMENILRFKLPKSAYQYPAWWANGEKSHSHASVWMDANYKVDEIHFGEFVIFERRD